jgi:hypothetical protein
MKSARLIAIAVTLAGACVVAAWMWTRASGSVTPEISATSSADPSARDASRSSALETESLAAPSRAEDESRAAMPAQESAGGDATAAKVDAVAVYGTISDSFTSARRIGGARVNFVQGSEAVTGTTDDDGRYSIDNLSPGSWKVSIDADGYRSSSKEHTLVDNLRLQQFDASLDRRNVVWVQFRTPDGKDLAAVMRQSGLAWSSLAIVLAATREAPSRRLARALALPHSLPMEPMERRNGQVIRMSSGLDRRYVFNEPLPMFLSACVGDVVLDTRYVKDDGEDVTFVISLDQLRESMHDVRVRVLDADSGEPITSAKAQFAYPTVNAMHADPVDAHGEVVFEQRPAGRWTLLVQAPDYETVNELITVATEGDTELVYRLARGVSIEGTIVGASGGSAPMWFELVAVERFDASHQPQRAISSNSSDHFELKFVGRAKYVLRPSQFTDTRAGKARCFGFKPLIVDTRDGSKRGLVIQALPLTTVTLRADPSRLDEIHIIDADLMPITEDSFSPNGKCEIRVVPGAYTAKLMKDGVLVDSVAFQVGSESQNVDLRR